MASFVVFTFLPDAVWWIISICATGIYFIIYWILYIIGTVLWCIWYIISLLCWSITVLINTIFYYIIYIIYSIFSLIIFLLYVVYDYILSPVISPIVNIIGSYILLPIFHLCYYFLFYIAMGFIVMYFANPDFKSNVDKICKELGNKLNNLTKSDGLFFFLIVYKIENTQFR